MSMQSIQVRAIAGTFILMSLALYHFHSHNWLFSLPS